jgi:hypothetical protein
LFKSKKSCFIKLYQNFCMYSTAYPTNMQNLNLKYLVFCLHKKWKQNYGCEYSEQYIFSKLQNVSYFVIFVQPWIQRI